MIAHRLRLHRPQTSLLEPLPSSAITPFHASPEGRHCRTKHYRGAHQDNGFYNQFVTATLWPAIIFSLAAITISAVLAVIGVPLGWGW